ncbi:ShlB/FhaC/HecB family hemolysin secretion/activation protein [Serratia sp. JUb9]|uniref:ShlB/FhaC/HecB family hemolysin secretion/activation protein n=1 Tax=Serratia sp. JUb9 TaxID=2724469 RepID=UPI00164D58EC|nr:ShlB/FhaC/HecB family hemolysin secretion/activation protein [Serratia sp. JUb9]QNK30812.1 ShlB/FhaC/HecB family hemolysin secretion/activation protein [Serratia sp. JUb9]
MLINKGCWFLVSWIGLIATAQATPVINPADQDVIERQQKALLEQAQQQRDDLKSTTALMPLPRPNPGSNDKTCHNVNRIAFLGAEHLSWSVKQKLVSSYQGRCLTLSHINNLVRETTNAYLQRGYVTSQAWLPAQDIAGGKLTVAVSEGRIDAISLNGEETPALKMVFPGLIGSVLNLRDIEQGMEQFNRLPSQQVTIDIQPGKRPGYSSVVLRRTLARLPVSVFLGADNGGQKSTGTGQLNASVILDNPLRLADQWSLSASRDSGFSHNRRSRSLNGGVTLPYGYWLFSVQAAWNDFYQHIPIQDARYRYQGNAVIQRLGANRTLLRDGQQKLALDMGLSRRRTENRLAGQRLSNSSVTVASLSAGLNYSRSLGGGYLTLNPTASHGLRGMGATPDEPAAPYAARSEFRKFSLSSSYFYPLTPNLYYLTSAYGQISADNLYAGERLSVGGQYSVRGFKEQYLTGNSGTYWRNELNWQLGTVPAIGDVSLTGALDGGWLRSEAHQVDGGSVVGAALGLTMNIKMFNQSFNVGKPLAYPTNLRPDRWVAYWQATVTL